MAADQYTQGGQAVVVKRSGERKTVTLGTQIGTRGDRVLARFTDATERPTFSDSDGDHYVSRGYRIDRDGGQIWDYA